MLRIAWISGDIYAGTITSANSPDSGDLTGSPGSALVEF